MKSILHFGFSPFQSSEQQQKTVENKTFSCKMLSSNYNNKNILFIKSIISNTDINNKQKNV